MNLYRSLGPIGLFTKTTRRKCPHKLLDLFFLNNRGCAPAPLPLLASARQGRRIIRIDSDVASITTKKWACIFHDRESGVSA